VGEEVIYVTFVDDVAIAGFFAVLDASLELCLFLL
jgi:hypothetical protein